MAAAAKKITEDQSPKTGRTVTVACKIPTGLVLQLCNETEFWEDTPSGAKKRKRFDRVGDRVVVRGPAEPNGQAPKGYPGAAPREGGYALTFGVDADFFEKWLEQNRELSLVKQGMIFAHTSLDHVKGKAIEQKDTRSGLEAIVPDNDPRLPKPIAGGLTGIETADEAKGRVANAAAE